MIRLDSISKSYPGGIHALEDVHLFIEAGEFVSIVGQSGTGKTTLVKLLIAEERPTRGRIEIGGWDITGIRDREVPLLRRQMGIIFQDFKLLPNKTAHENIAFALEVAGEQRGHINRAVQQLASLVGLEGATHRFPHEMSGGEQQRVAIARALAHRPKILVADEPTGNLDTINAQEIIRILKKVNEFGTTVLLVTHNREIVNGLKRRVITLDGGHITHDQKTGKYVI
ncbi:MAG: cell division ATP-binding protein FtsE [Candidatus Magasanikbacteria bacterium]|nr:cell division ATP-binding protein FtsE [Candidatus Magasanikbacteria bacterium]